MTHRNHRQEGVFNFEDFNAIPKCIAGVGAIGGFICKAMSYMDIQNVHLYDFDDVEEHNLGTQGFMPSHLGYNKVKARLFEASSYLSRDNQWTGYEHRWQRGAASRHLVFLCVDSLRARRQIYAELHPEALIIDTRMMSLQYQVYCVTPAHRARYEETLSDEGAAEGSCTTRSTLHAASVAASIALTMAMHVVSHAPAPFLVENEMWAWEGGVTW